MNWSKSVPDMGKRRFCICWSVIREGIPGEPILREFFAYALDKCVVEEEKTGEKRINCEKLKVCKGNI